MLLLLLSLPAYLIGDLPLLLLLVDGDAALDVVLQLSALSRGKLVQLKLEYLPWVGRQTLLDQVYDASLLLLGQGTDIHLQLVFLIYVHRFIRIGGRLGEHDIILDLSLRPLVFVRVAHGIKLLLPGGGTLRLHHGLWLRGMRCPRTGSAGSRLGTGC